MLGLLGSTALAGLGAGDASAQFLPSWLGAKPLARPDAPSDGSFDILHGVRIDDPFHPLEDASRPDVQAWIMAEDRAARDVLEAGGLHGRLQAFIRGALRYRRANGHRRLGSQMVATVQDGIHEQSWLEISANGTGEGRPLIDPNAMAADGSIYLSGFYADRLSQKLAYLTTENGGDAQTLRVRDVRTFQDLPDRIEGCRFSSVAWLPDGNSFYYTRPPLPGESAHFDRTSHLLLQHRLGTPQSDDRILWRLPDVHSLSLGIRVSYATNHLILIGRIGTDEKHGLWLGPLADPSRLETIIPLGRSAFWLIQSLGTALFAHTDHDAPRGRVVRVDATDPRPERWQTLVPEGNGVIDGATIVANRLVVRRFEGLGHHLSIHDLAGEKQLDVPFREPVRISFERGERSGTEIRLEIDDRRRPLRQVRLDTATGRLEPRTGERPPHTLDDIEIRQTVAKSPDGTEVPVTLMHLPGVVADGSNRTLLYGYGSYGISQLPAYSGTAAAWVRLGGVYAIATIRGGTEFGRVWHESGRLSLKRNAVSDFIAAAEHLIDTCITSPSRLGIYGASSGGRLVLGSMIRRPELFGAVTAGVPLVDMLRFHRHTFGAAWKPEYGDPEQAADFQWLRALSPLHNVQAGRTYPPLLLLTADNDQRVVPSHSYKMAATLRRASPDSEVYVRTRRGAGHGPGNALSKAVDYQADLIAFMTHKLGGPVRELAKL